MTSPRPVESIDKGTNTTGRPGAGGRVPGCAVTGGNVTIGPVPVGSQEYLTFGRVAPGSQSGPAGANEAAKLGQSLDRREDTPWSWRCPMYWIDMDWMDESCVGSRP